MNCMLNEVCKRLNYSSICGCNFLYKCYIQFNLIKTLCKCKKRMHTVTEANQVKRKSKVTVHRAIKLANEPPHFR